VPETFTLIAAQRRTVADLLDGLEQEQWGTASLCAPWTVREVAAHLTMVFQLSIGAMVLRMLRAKGNYDAVADEFARTAALAPTSSLVDLLRANADSRFTPPGLGPEAPLTDILVHGLDIAVPLGLAPKAPDEALNRGLDFLVSLRATRGFVKRGRLAGLRFVSVDTGWSSAGPGALVSGQATSLLLAITGRRAGLDGLSGDGVTELAARMPQA
jgi:uncharacterized protein (TIGR03083 family)